MNAIYNHQANTRPHKTARLLLATAPVLALLLLAATAPVRAETIDGFTRPYRSIEVAAAESGIITEIKVREGDTVQPQQLLAALDNDVHLALLAIAEKSMNARGRVDAALAELQLKQDRLRKFETLRASGHAQQQEVDRARMEVAIAEGQLTSAQEELEIRRMEHQKLATQLERRLIRSPIAGVVALAHKDQGEFVAPNNPDVFTVVQLDPLLAVFAVPSSDAIRLKVGEAIQIRFAGQPGATAGTIEFIAPVTDAESGTVQVKIKVENSDGLYRSGERCSLLLPG